MKVKIDKEKCIGCGSCVVVCDEAFELDDDNKAYFKKEAEKDNPECIKESVDICPVQAIEIVLDP